jgi:hypothetical protein
LASIDLVGLIFLLKNLLGTYSRCVNDREENQNALLSAENARKEKKTFRLTINVFTRSKNGVTTC